MPTSRLGHGRPPFLFASRAQLLGPQPAFLRGACGRRRATWAFHPQCIVYALSQAVQRQLPVAGLRPLVAGYHPYAWAQAFEEQVPLARRQDGRASHIEDQLCPRVGGVGVLATRPAAGAEAPLEFGRRDNEPPPPDPQALIAVHQLVYSFRVSRYLRGLWCPRRGWPRASRIITPDLRPEDRLLSRGTSNGPRPGTCRLRTRLLPTIWTVRHDPGRRPSVNPSGDHVASCHFYRFVPWPWRPRRGGHHFRCRTGRRGDIDRVRRWPGGADGRGGGRRHVRRG
jgi:hypothetical protein